MSREKQFEEMAITPLDVLANDIYQNCPDLKENYCGDTHCVACLANALYNEGWRKLPDNIGEFSDGYHTFNELYHHRAVLFSVICNMFPEKAWKSKLHDTGDMFDGMFIVGIETEQGQATYHYDIEPYWDMFKVKELEKAPKWDGHTPSDAIQRIGNIKQSEWISVEDRLPEPEKEVLIFAIRRYKYGQKIQEVPIITTAMYENGTISNEDSIWNWYDIDFIYDEENDIEYVPEGWWEFRHYNPDDVYINAVDDEVTHWMPLPEAPKMTRKEDEGK